MALNCPLDKKMSDSRPRYGVRHKHRGRERRVWQTAAGIDHVAALAAVTLPHESGVRRHIYAHGTFPKGYLLVLLARRQNSCPLK